ncbi:hypothetical protein AXG93_3052s1150 [Marchantia polymorpha subsp. ruderalis]|uniref:Reverse transcriptase Ty1/copia-type domain-containing protein n=1 Tax=Marchantia polymorpha subsp. ruderalis TaxID=1480154 RepID=A0A176WKK3_MARPO|nr:hypothetical protein AXG93_3052s1150 [Marchantia polymorpha subsp. ruderalis]
MERKMGSLIDNKTWELVEPPTDQTLIDSKWVYKLKDNPTGDEAKIFKARLVVKDQMDVVTAKLYEYIENEIYMKQPVGFEVKVKESLVGRLLESLYGLKQAHMQ